MMEIVERVCEFAVLIVLALMVTARMQGMCRPGKKYSCDEGAAVAVGLFVFVIGVALLYGAGLFAQSFT